VTYVRTVTVEVCTSTGAADVAGIADDVARRGASFDGVWFGFGSRSRQGGREGSDEDPERETHGVMELFFLRNKNLRNWV